VLCFDIGALTEEGGDRKDEPPGWSDERISFKSFPPNFRNWSLLAPFMAVDLRDFSCMSSTGIVVFFVPGFSDFFVS